MVRAAISRDAAGMRREVHEAALQLREDEVARRWLRL